MSAALKVVWQKGQLQGECPKRLFMGMMVGESLRRLFCEEGLAFKTGQPFHYCPIQRAFKEFP